MRDEGLVVEELDAAGVESVFAELVFRPDEPAAFPRSGPSPPPPLSSFS
jgi:hypothetical protein